MNELWRNINGYNGKYEVSTFGRVRSKNFRNKQLVKVLKTNIKGDRYLKVTLTDNEGKRKTFYVHRLVAAAFIINDDPEKKYVNHKDGNKLNNHLENIEYVTARDNTRNPATYPNMFRRYHRPGEWQRRSTGQRNRFKREREQHLGRYANKNIRTS